MYQAYAEAQGKLVAARRAAVDAERRRREAADQRELDCQRRIKHLEARWQRADDA